MNDDAFQILENEIRLAGKAKEVLNHEAFKAAFSKCEEALLAAMKAAAIGDDKFRLRLVDKYEALHSIRTVLQDVMDTGAMAEEQLRQKSLGERFRQFISN